MKKIILTLALAAMTTAAFAQNFGVKAGANLGSIKDMEFDNYSTMNLGAYIGVVGEIGLPVANLGIRLEPTVSLQGASYKNDDWKQNVNVDLITLPIMAEYKLLGGDLAIMAGPQIGVVAGMSVKEILKDSSTKVKVDSDDYNTIDFGLTFGATYMVTENVGIDFRYNLGLSNLFPETKLYDAYGKNRVFQIGACYMF